MATSEVDHTMMAPAEIVREVFKFIFESSLQEYKLDIYQMLLPDIPLILGSVCSRWRHVVRSMPLLWTFIQLNLTKYNKENASKGNEQLLRLYVNLSGGLPIHVAITGLGVGISLRDKLIDSSIYPVSLIPSSRVSSFFLRSALNSRHLYPNINLSLNFPHLQILSLIGMNLSKGRPSPSDLPKDYYRQWTHGFGAFDFCFTNCILPTLSSFVVSHARIERRDNFNGFPGTRNLHLRKLYGMLSNASKLASSDLQSLILEDCNYRIFGLLLAQIPNIPSNLIVKSCILPTDLGLGDFLKVKGHTLTKLELIDLPWAVVAEQLTDVPLPLMKELKLEESGQNNLFTTGNGRDNVDKVLDILQGSNNKFPRLAYIGIKSHRPIIAKGLVAFLSLHPTPEPFRLQISRSSLTAEDYSLLQGIVVVTLID